MTSLQSRRKPRMTSSHAKPVMNEGIESLREGIFDQFSEDSSSEMYYYTVYSSSDSEGNLTIQDVTREKFGSDVRELTCEEKGEMEDDSDVTKQRYGFRTRRLKRQRDDEIHSAFYTNSSDESTNEASEHMMSSDDETYDITADNWAYVRGAKKKTTPESNKKKNDSPQKTKAKLKSKSSLLKIRLKAAFKRTKPKPKKEVAEKLVKNENVVEKSPRVPPIPEGSPKKVPKISPKRKLPIKARFKSGNLMSSFDTDKTSSTPLAVPPMPSLKKKSPSRIRCGYNPTAPKIPELRHIRRRQLRQNPKRVLKTNLYAPDDVTSSSDDETAEEVTKTMRRSSTHSLRAPSRGRENRKLSNTDDKSKQISDTSHTSPKTNGHNLESNTSPRKRGLKLVIRRDSIETKDSVALGEKKPKVEEKQPSSDNIKEKQLNLTAAGATEKTKNKNKTVKHKTLPSKMDPKVVLERSSKISTNANSTSGVNKSEPDQTGIGNRNAKEDIPTVPTSQCTVIPEDKVADNVNANKTNDDETIKKKKPRKKKKKDRGRASSSAGSEDTLDGKETAMRLAMELPNHNWLVKHLIKENKIKAEDDKPLNNVQSPELTPGDPTTTTVSGAGNTTPTTTSSTVKDQSSNSESVKSTESSVTTDKAQISADKTTEDNFKSSSNNVKGSSMVGIVKPFDHLIKMSPTNMESNNEMSPPPLCIIDEEESNNANTESSGVINANSSGKQVSISSSSCGSLANSHKTNDVTQKQSCVTIAKATNRECRGVDLVPQSQTICQVFTTMPVGNCKEQSTTSSTELSTNQKMLMDKTQAHKEVNSNFNPDLTIGHVGTSEQSNDKSGSDESVETDPHIKISNCFSLALDLSKRNLDNTESDSQPLDLSTGPKKGQISPKILDLSIKKAPESSPSLSIMSQEKPTNLTTTVKQASAVSSPKPVKEPVIIIDDDIAFSRETFIRKPAHLTQNNRPKHGATKRPESSSSSDGSSVKRCVSLDSAKTPDRPSSSSPLKRVRDVRRSFDDAKRMKIDENRTQTVQTGFNKFHSPKTLPPVLKQTVETRNQTVINKPGSRGIVTDTRIQKSPKRQIDGNKWSADSLASKMANYVTDSNSPAPSIPKLPSHLPPVPPSKRIEANSMQTDSIPQHVNRFDNNNVSHISGPRVPTSNRTNFSPNRVIQRTAGSNNIGSPRPTPQQLVAQAYQPDIQHLEPYIKQQQMEVDKKIKELEKIKRELDKVQLNKTSPLPPQTTVPSSFPIPIPRQILHNQKSSPPKYHGNYSLPTNQRQAFPVSQNQPNPLHTSYIRGPPIPHPSTNPLHPLSQYRHPTNQGPMQSQFLQSRPMQPQIQQTVQSRGQAPMRYPQYQVRAPPPQHTSNSGHAFLQQHVLSPNISIASNQIRRPPRQIHSQQMMNRHPRQAPPTITTPVYRNGGLTIQGGETSKAKLDEPIIIEDDMNLNLRQLSSKPSITHATRLDALKARRSHSFHPPLSKNRPDSQNVHQPPKKWMGSSLNHMPKVTQETAHPQPSPEAIGEVCVKCRGKAFFLCSGCRKMWYCSKKCQLDDWSSHSSKCTG